MKSIEKKVEFTCPQCGKVQESICYEQLGPDKYLDVSNSSIFQWDCNECGHKIKLVYPTYYCNIEKEFVVFLDPKNEEVKGLTQEQMALFRGFAKRLCKNSDTFVEKVRVLEAGLNDRAIELLKLITMAKLHSKDNSVLDIFFYRKSESNSLEFTVIYKEDIDGIDIDYAMYENVLAIVLEELPELSDEVHCIDLDWAGKQVAM